MMKYLPIALCVFLLSAKMIAQKPSRVYLDPDLIQGELVRTTVNLSEFSPSPFDGVIVKTEKLGYHPKSDWILNDSINPMAKPNGPDPVWQKTQGRGMPLKSLNQNYDGMSYTSVNPPDPCLDVSSTHVIQMINGSGGSYFKIWDKSGAVLQNQTYFDSFTGISGAGDPIVLYDQFADRWLMSEFSATGNKLVVAISQTPDPMGSWYVYSYTAPNFPDYPKYAIWSNAIIVTTNETSPSVYALDRGEMLSGNPGVMQRFTVPPYGTISFQALTPVDIDGSALPPAGSPALVMRMADDAWDPTLNQDQLEIFEFDIDFANPGNTSLSLVQTIPTAPFDTHLCGYTAFACIEQQGSSVTLDPLREVLMNRIHYRNFGSYEVMVMCHATDVNANDQAGVRWYELRKTSGSWSIHQQGTYAPDGESRWMASIAINNAGDIALAYNISSSSSYPSLKYTGRRSCDPAGLMTEPEIFLASGNAANGSNRYGDYASMSVDPADDSFWFTGEYNPSSQWSTRISNFDFSSCQPSVSFDLSQQTAQESDATIDNNCLDYQELVVSISLSQAANVDPTVNLVLSGNAEAGTDYEAPQNLSATLTPSSLTADFIFKIYDDAYVETIENLTIDYTLNANGGNAIQGGSNQSHVIEIISNDLDPQNANGQMSVVFTEDFESNSLGNFTTINPSGDTPYQVSTHSNASSSSFNIPAPPSGTYISFVNDDDCDCNQNDVKLMSQIFSLTNTSQAELVFNYYYEDNSYQGDQEEAKVLISTNGGVTFTEIHDLSASSGWDSKSLDLSNYLGMSNLKIAFQYSDGGGWLYGLAVDDVKIESTSSLGIQTAVNSSMAPNNYLGPNSTVHFFDPTSGNIMATITNSSSHDYGCTTLEVDRDGSNDGTIVFNYEDPANYLTSKSFKVTPDNPGSGTYTLDLYFKESEIASWESLSNNVRDDVLIVKVDGDNAVSDVNPSNASNFTINSYSTVFSAFNEGHKITSTIDSGFSGFGLGIPYENSCVIQQNIWQGPASASWFDDAQYWSLGIFPNLCHEVIIPAGNLIQVLNGQQAEAYLIWVYQGSELDVQPGAELFVSSQE